LEYQVAPNPTTFTTTTGHEKCFFSKSSLHIKFWLIMYFFLISILSSWESKRRLILLEIVRRASLAYKGFGKVRWDITSMDSETY
jgi:hypothetical protein